MSVLPAFQEALRHSPDNVPLLLLYGRACLEELQLDDALVAYERALDLDPRLTDAQLGLAKALLARGEASQAAVRVEMALQQEPNNAAAHLLLSRISLAEGDDERAERHYERARQLDASVADAGLESELAPPRGGSAAASRRPVERPEPTPAEMPMGLEADDADLEPEVFMDEPPFDWRPENFWMPGDPERGRLNFDDITGLEDIKEEIRRKLVYPLQEPELYRTYGHQPGGALLLYGPPGCGKTLLLRAVAAEVSCNYLWVGLHELFDPYFGSTERNLHQMFDTARFSAPCVVVIDGLDSLAQDRRTVRESQARNVVNQLLHELDSLRTEGRRVMVLAATSQPWSLDPALRRPGRFEQALFVPPPDPAARLELLRRCAEEKPVGALDLDELTRLTEGFSCADLQWLFDRASELALGEAMRTGHALPIQQKQLLQIARTHTPTTSLWFEGVQEGVEGTADKALLKEVRGFMGSRSLKR
ncbi:MAG: AAA family ATPase [Verrucomicrobiales bacterium]|nr:AAA family ATPase [Verrucomicrobiales bacterium]